MVFKGTWSKPLTGIKKLFHTLMTDWGIFRQRTAPQPEYNNGSPPFFSNPLNASLNHSQSMVISGPPAREACLSVTTRWPNIHVRVHTKRTRIHWTVCSKTERMWERLPAVPVKSAHLHLLLDTLTWSIDNRCGKASTSTCCAMG
jgi:hypothetical protein